VAYLDVRSLIRASRAAPRCCRYARTSSSLLPKQSYSDALATPARALSAYYPSLSLNGSAGLESTSIANLFNWPSGFWAVGLSLAETVFDGGRRRANTAAARAAYDASIADYRQTTLTAFQQVEDNLAALGILEREAEQQDEAVESARNNLRIFNDRYVGGRDSYLQVITAQTTYLDNERNRVDIRRRRMDATVLLVKALGGGWTASALPQLGELTHR
jgi:outer membrane protein TolC